MTIYWSCEPIGVTNPGDWVICPLGFVVGITIVVLGFAYVGFILYNFFHADIESEEGVK